MAEFDDKAKLAKEKKAVLGPDIDLESYCVDGECHLPVEKLDELSQEDQDLMLKAGNNAYNKY